MTTFSEPQLFLDSTIITPFSQNHGFYFSSVPKVCNWDIRTAVILKMYFALFCLNVALSEDIMNDSDYLPSAN
jgi:hypothetical protein